MTNKQIKNKRIQEEHTHTHKYTQLFAVACFWSMLIAIEQLWALQQQR